ncbi:MAG: DISARM system phospholipase D-like protein DrmC [Myxococcota bacterium]|jgi:phosphatidylserine/phosphatidylglycerophosphate/cardiolipin synthase-like enzyme|nr:DISARM system phospholipase D-like protein DrmC [Myxococcota bacterium]
MSSAFRALGRASLLGLAQALRAGRVAAPFARSALAVHAPEEQLGELQQALQDLSAQGMSALHLATMLDLLAEERREQQARSDRVELVLSPPEFDGVDARDTSVVVAELFRQARVSVLIVSFALDKGEKAAAIFGELAGRMDAEPDLQVRLCANIHRKQDDHRPAASLVEDFGRDFPKKLWPGQRLPELYFDRRSVELETQRRAVLHAKCVVVDGRWSLLSSANFTEAAQERNIEAGVLVDDERMAQRLLRQFEALIQSGVLQRLRLPG